jgi:hypothetical protein
MRFLGILILSVLVVVTFSAAVIGQAPGPAPAPPPLAPLRMPPPMAIRSVCPSQILSISMNMVTSSMTDCTDEQRSKITDAQEKFQAKLTTLNTALQAATKQLVDAIAGDSTPAQLKELSGNASKAEADVLQTRVDFWAELKTILTPDQYKKVAIQPQMRFQAMGSGSGGPRMLPPIIPPPTPPAGTPPPAPPAAPPAPPAAK